jgi:hypothetical protein
MSKDCKDWERMLVLNIITHWFAGLVITRQFCFYVRVHHGWTGFPFGFPGHVQIAVSIHISYRWYILWSWNKLISKLHECLVDLVQVFVMFPKLAFSLNGLSSQSFARIIYTFLPTRLLLLIAACYWTVVFQNWTRRQAGRGNFHLLINPLIDLYCKHIFLSIKFESSHLFILNGLLVYFQRIIHYFIQH